MIKSLTLGKKTFANNLIQGPLAGISCAPFRRLTWEYSKPAFSCTEMISCKTLINGSRFNHRFVTKCPKEGSVCFQLSSNDPHELGIATNMVTDFGADLIDLNCGCPVHKIRSKGAGSKHLMDPAKLYKMICAMKSNTHVPVSIKIRIDGRSKDRYNEEILNVVRDGGVDYLIVHGRHWTEHYETPCNYDQIQFFVDSLDIPVIGNGDVACLESLKKMFATGCAGVMIARAGVGQPWLIGKLIAEMQSKTFQLPDTKTIGALFVTHIQELMELLNSEKFAVIQARKFAKYYARGLPHRIEFTNEINLCESMDNLQKICQRFFY